MTLPKGWYHKCAMSRQEYHLLEVLGFWWPKAHPRYDGHKWLVWSMEEWSQRLGWQDGGPSDKTVRRRLKALEKRGIITTRLGKHPYQFKTVPALWVRPDEEGIRAFLTGNVTANMTGNVTGTIVQLNSETASQLEALDIAAPSEAQSKEAQMKTTGADFLLNKKKGATIAGAMQVAASGPKTAKDFPLIKKPQEAHDCIVAACRAAGYPNPGALTMKRTGQLKVMISRMGMELASYAGIAQVLFFVIGKWPEYQGWTKTKFNATVPGTAPNHDALTMYAVEAVGFWSSYQASNTVQEKPSAGSSNLDDDF